MVQQARQRWHDAGTQDLDALAEWGRTARAAQDQGEQFLERIDKLPDGPVKTGLEEVGHQLGIIVIDAALGTDDDYQRSVETFDRFVNEVLQTIAGEMW